MTKAYPTSRLRSLCAVFLTVVAMGGCAARGGGTPAPSPVAGHAQAGVGSFVLVFDMERTSWSSTDVISGHAELRYLGSGMTHIGASGGGPIAFDVHEVNGDRHAEGAMTLDCVTTPISRSAPITSGLTKGGALDTPFAQSFLTAKDYRLPAGNWDITAWAIFNDGSGCSGRSQSLRATIRIHVTPAT